MQKLYVYNYKFVRIKLNLSQYGTRKQCKTIKHGFFINYKYCIFINLIMSWAKYDHPNYSFPYYNAKAIITVIKFSIVRYISITTTILLWYIRPGCWGRQNKLAKTKTSLFQAISERKIHSECISLSCYCSCCCSVHP